MLKLTELGVSQRETFELCQRKWYYANLFGRKSWGIVPVRQSLARDFGSIGHKGLQTWYAQLATGVSPEAALEPARRAMIEYKAAKLKEWEAAVGVVGDDDPNERAELGMVDWFLEGYAKFYRDDAEWEIIGVERDFSIDPKVFYGWDIFETALSWYDLDDEGEPLPLIRGTVDLIIRNPKGKGLIVVDHKFHKFIDTDLQEPMPYWKQPMIYCRAIELLYGEPVVGYIHNQIRKPTGLKPRLDKASKTYESAEEFEARLKLEYIDFPDYNQSYSSGGTAKKGYFARSDVIDVNTSDPQFLLELATLDCEMVSKANSIVNNTIMPLPIFQRRSPKSTCKRFGQPCEYMDLCMFGHSPAVMEQFVERTEPHP